jgi:hypothetical protein
VLFAAYGGGFFGDGSRGDVIGIDVHQSAAAVSGGCAAFSRSTVLLKSVTYSLCIATFGGGLYVGELSNIVLDGAIMSGNTAINGSGIYVNSSTIASSVQASDPSRIGVIFDDNVAAVAGGGIFVTGSPSSIQRITIENSTAPLGGGVFVANSRLAVLEDLLIRENYATTAGGGLAAETSQVSIGNVTVALNEASSLGGGVYVVNAKLSGSLMVRANTAETGAGAASIGGSELDGTFLSENVATVAGGGLAATSGSLTLHHVIIARCTARTGIGGGLFAVNSRVVFDNLRIESCVALQGGGVYVNGSALAGYTQSGALTPLQATLIDNAATDAGGGICIVGDGSSISDLGVNNATAATGGGFAVINARHCTISRTFVGSSLATETGGGAYFTSGSDCTLRDSTLTNNAAGQPGGGLAVIDSILRHSNLTVSRNTASTGGGIFAASREDTLSVIKLATSGWTRSSIYSNQGDGGGANVWLDCTLSCELEGLMITGANLTDGSGGGMFITGPGSAKIAESVFQNNFATLGGGIAVIDSGSTTLESVAFLGNTAQTGGGLWSSVSSITIADSIFYNNTAVTEGGGVFIERASLHADRVLVVENRAGDSQSGVGGGFRLDNAANATIENSLFMCNAAFYGGALAGAAASSIVIAESGIKGGTRDMDRTWLAFFNAVSGSTYTPWKAISTGVSSKHGGLLYLVDKDTSAELRDSEFTEGSAESGGGAYISLSAYLQLEGTTFVANTASESGGSICLSQSAQAYLVDSTITSSSKQRMKLAQTVAGHTLTWSMRAF